MKNLFSIMALTMLFLGNVKAQMNNWALSPNSRNMTTTSVTATNIGQAGFGSNYGVPNGAYDSNNNLLFYVVGGYVYQPGNPKEIFFLTELADDIIGSEISIVPIPGTCDKYYIIYCKGTLALNQFRLVYKEVQATTTTVTSLTSTPIIIGTSSSFGVAVSKVISGGGTTAKRFLYTMTSGGINRFDITNTGITNQQNVVNTTTAGLSGAFNGSAELELSSAGDKLAWGRYSNAYVITLNASTGAYSGVNIPKTFITPGICGIEFDATGANLFVSAGTATAGGIYKSAWNAPNQGIAVTTIAGDMYKSQLELAKNGWLYGVRKNTSGALELVGINTATNAQTVTSLFLGTNLVYDTGFYDTYCLPDQVDGEDYNAALGSAVVTPTLVVINGALTTATCGNTLPNWYNCQAMTFGTSYSSGSPNAYMLEIYQMGAAGSTSQCSVVSGVNFVSYASAWLPGGLGSVDLRTFTGTNGKNLGNTTGRFMLKYSLKNACGTVTSITRYIKTSSGPTPNSILRMNAGNSNSWDNDPSATYPALYCGPTPSLTPVSVGQFSLSININNSNGDITNYAVTIDRVDCTTGAVLASIPCPNGSANVTDISIVNALGLNFVTNGWFAGQTLATLQTQCFRLNLTLSNPCSSASSCTFFKIGGAYRPANPDIDNPTNKTTPNVVVQTLPNPFSTTTNLAINSEQEGEGVLNIFSVTGSRMLEQHLYLSAGTQQIPINATDWATGVYFYQLQLNGEIHTGKLLKE
jgi:hypothetical protein